jgi:L-lactate utilization protein LutC
MAGQKMSTARTQVLGAIKRALGPHDTQAAAERLAQRPMGPQPERSQGSVDDLLARFQAEAKRVTAEIISVGPVSEIPDAIAKFAAERGISGPWRITPGLRDLPWDQSGHNVLFSPADLTVSLGVSRAIAGIAETGTILMTSGADDSMLLAFVAEIHVITLARSAIVGSLEQAWAKLSTPVPRSAVFATGPSRTADIEMTPEFGAHGPKVQVIILHE